MARKDVAALQQRIVKLEQRLLEDKKKLAKLKHKIPPQDVADYELLGSDGKKTKLSQLFEGYEELIMIFNMGKSCRYCTMWADGFNGLRHHLENRAAFVVVSPDDPKIQREFARGRGWKFRMFSHKGTTMARDLDFATEDNRPYPGVVTFHRTAEGSLLQTARAYFGPGDDFCPAWHLFDLLLRGANGWEPQYSYDRPKRKTPNRQRKVASRRRK